MKRLIIVLAVLGAIIIITCLVVGASPMMYFIFLGMLVVAGVIAAPIYKHAEAMLKDGKIIKRDASFMESAQTFTIKSVSMEDLIAALKQEGLPFAGLEWKTGNQAMGFRYSGWTAEMVKLAGDGSRDKYKFSFTQWQTMRYGNAVNATQMNQLLTAIEKAFIKLDPSAKVSTERIQVKTKSSFF